MRHLTYFQKVLIVWGVSVLTSLNLFYADFSNSLETKESPESIIFENASIDQIHGDPDKYIGKYVSVYGEVYRTAGLDFWNFYEVKDIYSDKLITVLPLNREGIPSVVGERKRVKAKVVVLIKIFNYRKIGLKVVPEP